MAETQFSGAKEQFWVLTQSVCVRKEMILHVTSLVLIEKALENSKPRTNQPIINMEIIFNSLKTHSYHHLLLLFHLQFIIFLSFTVHRSDQESPYMHELPRNLYYMQNCVYIYMQNCVPVAGAMEIWGGYTCSLIIIC